MLLLRLLTLCDWASIISYIFCTTYTSSEVSNRSSVKNKTKLRSHMSIVSLHCLEFTFRLSICMGPQFPPHIGVSLVSVWIHCSVEAQYPLNSRLPPCLEAWAISISARQLYSGLLHSNSSCMLCFRKVEFLFCAETQILVSGSKLWYPSCDSLVIKPTKKLGQRINLSVDDDRRETLPQGFNWAPLSQICKEY